MTSKNSVSEAIVNRLVVIGLGLIGSSLAAIAREKGLANQVIGISRRQSTLEIALTNGIIDRSAESLEQIASELGSGDLVVVAVPTLSVRKILQDCASSLSADVTITDVASVKESVVEAAQSLYGEVPPQLVPGHPIAGSEKSGVTAANAKLFIDHRVILTPVETTAEDHLGLVVQLWEAAGASVSTMSVQEHDQILAATSHLPHFLAYSLVDTLASMRDKNDIFRYAAGGFRDFTRIAGSDPVMWRDIALANREAIINVMDQMMDNLQAMKSAIDRGDSDYLANLFSRARDARNQYSRMLESNKSDTEIDNL